MSGHLTGSHWLNCRGRQQDREGGGDIEWEDYHREIQAGEQEGVHRHGGQAGLYAGSNYCQSHVLVDTLMLTVKLVYKLSNCA